MVPSLSDLQLSLDEILAGGRLSFAAAGPDGTEIKLFIRQPTIAERDEAGLVRSLERARLFQRPDVAELAQTPLPPHELASIEEQIAGTLKALEREDAPERVRWLRDQLGLLYAAKKESAADALVEKQAEQARRRWLAPKLLVDESGQRVAGDEAAWLALPPGVQDAATVKTGEMLKLMYVLPFSSGTASAPKP